jgi:hypothetical protein
MGEWDRRTLWRQGCILTANTVASLQLAGDADSTRCVVVVVSHDCDLAQSPDREPVIEVIVGRRVDGPETSPMARIRDSSTFPRRRGIPSFGSS